MGVQSARYFAREYFGAGQARALTWAVALLWALLVVALGALGLVWPQAPRRIKARQRASQLRSALSILLRSPLPSPISAEAAATLSAPSA